MGGGEGGGKAERREITTVGIQGSRRGEKERLVLCFLDFNVLPTTQGTLMTSRKRDGQTDSSWAVTSRQPHNVTS